MHQPIYYPGETLTESASAVRYCYNLYDVFNRKNSSRLASGLFISHSYSYTNWPANAVNKGIDAGLGHLSAQVSFSGSLVQNLNVLEEAGNANFSNWKNPWNTIKTKLTSSGNPRIDMVVFGEYHPLMPLIDTVDIRLQIRLHKEIFVENFSAAYS